jgi:glyceraldehyde-3-phosphate dehydrogenase (NADP+)
MEQASTRSASQVRQPVGIVVAITLFNFPGLLVLHKIAPALAAGTAFALAACFVDAGLPEGVLSVFTGPAACSARR